MGEDQILEEGAKGLFIKGMGHVLNSSIAVPSSSFADPLGRSPLGAQVLLQTAGSYRRTQNKRRALCHFHTPCLVTCRGMSNNKGLCPLLKYRSQRTK